MLIYVFIQHLRWMDKWPEIAAGRAEDQNPFVYVTPLEFTIPLPGLSSSLTHEARSSMSTGFLAHLSLKHSTYIEDYDFKDCPELEEILATLDGKTYLLFPSAEPTPLSHVKSCMAMPSKEKINIIVIEGTWSQARVILAKSEKLKNLPHISLQKPRLSRFKIRTQPTSECLSTIEAVAYLLTDLGDIAEEKTDEFLAPFLTLVERQIDFQKINSPRYRRKWEQDTEGHFNRIAYSGSR